MVCTVRQQRKAANGGLASVFLSVNQRLYVV